MAFDGLLMREIGFRGISIWFGFSPDRLAFVAFGFMTFDGFAGFESHQKPRKAIKSPFTGFLMHQHSVSALNIRVAVPTRPFRIGVVVFGSIV